jgi:hypothetical protein
MSEDEKNGPALDDANLGGAHLQERREPRYNVHIAIEVSGITRDNRAFHERTATVNVSEWGCAFPVSSSLELNEIVTLRLIPVEGQAVPSNRRVLFQVVRSVPEADHWMIAAWKLEPGDFWGIALGDVTRPETSRRDDRQCLPRAGAELDGDGR